MLYGWHESPPIHYVREAIRETAASLLRRYIEEQCGERCLAVSTLLYVAPPITPNPPSDVSLGMVRAAQLGAKGRPCPRSAARPSGSRPRPTPSTAPIWLAERWTAGCAGCRRRPLDWLRALYARSAQAFAGVLEHCRRGTQWQPAGALLGAMPREGGAYGRSELARDRHVHDAWATDAGLCSCAAGSAGTGGE